MNQNQKRILFAVIAIIVVMLAYPPFQVIAIKGVVFNMGYDWLFAPPKRGNIAATVNIPMLALQWIGTLVVGGIAFFLAKSRQELQAFSNQTAPTVHGQSSIEGPQSIPTIEKSTTLALPSISFRDPTRLAQWLRYFLFASIVINVVALISGALQYQLLTDFKLGVYSSVDLATAAAETNDQRQQVVGLLQGGIAIVTIILFTMWIYRASFNARALGARNMKFTPGWAVGCYFVPILNLWAPYQAMKEIWKVSKNPPSWENEERGVILPWWWFFFIIYSMLRNISFRASLSAKKIDEIIASAGVSIISEVVSIPAIITAIILLNRINEFQVEYVNGLRKSEYLPIDDYLEKQADVCFCADKHEITECNRQSRKKDGGIYTDTSIIFQNMTGQHEMLSSRYRKKGARKALYWTLFSLATLFLLIYLLLW